MKYDFYFIPSKNHISNTLLLKIKNLLEIQFKEVCVIKNDLAGANAKKYKISYFILIKY